MTITNGQTPDADDVLNITKVHELYTGTGFDSSQSVTGTNNDEFELTAISSSVLGDATYAVVKITVNSLIACDGDGSANSTLTAQIKETGDSYSSMGTGTLCRVNSSDGSNALQSSYFGTIELISVLTGGMITNGYQIKILTSSIVGSPGGSASVTNVQTVQEVRP